MMSSGFLSSEAVMGNVNTKLEAAIEDLRIKYEKKRQMEEEVKRKEAEAKGEEERIKASKAEADWVMDDPELENLRKVRNTRLGCTKTTNPVVSNPRANGSAIPQRPH
jgi:hypothetical protein